MKIKQISKKKKKLSGGRRAGSGRHKADDPKLQITLYVESSKIDTLGNKAAVQKLCYTKINEETVKNMLINQDINKGTHPSKDWG